MKVAEKLISLRKAKGLSQLKLAEMMDVSRQAVSRWEVGDAVPSVDNLKFLSKLYCVPVDYLLNDDIKCPSQSEVSEEHTTKEKKPTRKVKKCVVIVACMIIIAVVVGMIYRGVIHGDLGNRDFNEMGSEKWEDEDAGGFSLTW